MTNEPSQGATPGERDMRRMRRAQEVYRDRLLRIPGVHAIGIGYKRVDGRVTDELAVVVYVDRKMPRDRIRPDQMIPEQLRFHFDRADREEAVRTDVVQRSRGVEFPHIADGDLVERVRPVPGGYRINGGTLGAWVYDNQDGQVVLLSNHHVLGGTEGSEVFQPGTGAPNDHIADVVRAGTLDATVAAPSGSDIVAYEIAGIGPAVFDVAEATLNMQVEKTGATTEHTTGRVVVVNLVTNHYGSTNDFEVEPDQGPERFAFFGDSGSVIVEREHPEGASFKRVVGLLWGGNPAEGTAWAHQLTDVFADLDLTGICSGVVASMTDGMFAQNFAALPEPPRVEFPRQPAGRRPVARQPADLVPAGRRLARHVGIARDIERHIRDTPGGARLSEAVHRDRVPLARLSLDREAMRALDAAVLPFVKDTWTAEEILDRKVSGDDLARFQRALEILAKRQPQLRDLVGLAGDLLRDAAGKRVADLLD